jgi:hypothetical protein
VSATFSLKDTVFSHFHVRFFGHQVRARIPSPPYLPPHTTSIVAELKQWLKRHRLHKYASNFSTITYAGMLDLQDADLEGLGITAQGARTKMLKSIADLKLLNGQHEFDLAQIYKEMGAGLYSDAIQGLSTLFQLQNSSSGGFIDGPSPPGFNLAAAAMHVVHGLISELITNATHDRSQATADAIVALASFLDQAIRLEFFSVDQRSQLFSWKAEAETALMAHNPNIRPPPSSSSGLDARSKGFEPKWRSADPRTKEQDMDANGESVWGVPESNLGGYSTVARRAVKPTRTTRPYSTGSLFHIDPAGPQQFLPDANLPPDSVSLRSLSSLGSGDLFDPIWGQMGNGAAQETGSGELAFKADDHTTTGGDQPFQATDAVSGTSSAAGPIFMQQTTESEFQRRSWINDDNSARERSATDAGIPSFWGAEDENIQALTLSMTAILDDEVAKRHSVM